MARSVPACSQAGSPPWLGVSASSSSLPRSSEDARSPVDCDCEAVGECEAHRDGGRRFAGLSGREKQGWRDGASAEQGSSSMDPGSTLTISPVLLSLLRLGGLCEGSLLSSFKACSKSFLFKILAAFSASVYPGGADKSCLILVTSDPSSFCVSVPRRRGLGDLPRAFVHGSCNVPSSGLGSADLDRLPDLGHFWKVS